jgi:hypothetical protein
MRVSAFIEHDDGELVFRHACKLGLEGIVSKRLGSRYRSGRSPDWLKMKNPDAPAVKRKAPDFWRPGFSVGRRNGPLRTRRNNLQSAPWEGALRSSSA